MNTYQIYYKEIISMESMGMNKKEQGSEALKYIYKGFN